jgi:hypothetical protein
MLYVGGERGREKCDVPGRSPGLSLFLGVSLLVATNGSRRVKLCLGNLFLFLYKNGFAH